MFAFDDAGSGEPDAHCWAEATHAAEGFPRHLKCPQSTSIPPPPGPPPLALWPLPPPALIPLCTHTVLLPSACSFASAPCPCFLLFSLPFRCRVTERHECNHDPPTPAFLVLRLATCFGLQSVTFQCGCTCWSFSHLITEGKLRGLVTRQRAQGRVFVLFCFTSVLLEHYHAATSMLTCKAVIAEILFFNWCWDSAHKKNFQKEKILLLTRG